MGKVPPTPSVRLYRPPDDDDSDDDLEPVSDGLANLLGFAVLVLLGAAAAAVIWFAGNFHFEKG